MREVDQSLSNSQSHSSKKREMFFGFQESTIPNHNFENTTLIIFCPRQFDVRQILHKMTHDSFLRYINNVPRVMHLNLNGLAHGTWKKQPHRVVRSWTVVQMPRARLRLRWPRKSELTRYEWNSKVWMISKQEFPEWKVS